MARQTTTPVEFERTVRPDTNLVRSSGRAGVVTPVGFFPMFPGDSCSGQFGIDIKLAEMPRPLENAVFANVQAWFVPKSAHPQFSGPDELRHAMTGDVIKALGAADRTPPAFFEVINGASLTTVAASNFFKTLGLHVPAGSPINSDLIDAFVLIYNFRLAAHSSALARRQYFAEDEAEAIALPPAFWPSGRFSSVVPDYERALVVGSLDLDVLSGRIPIDGISFRLDPSAVSATWRNYKNPTGVTRNRSLTSGANVGIKGRQPGQEVGESDTGPTSTSVPDLYAQFDGQTIGVTLADIDKARTTQAFAKLRTAYAGNDATGFDNDDAIVSLLMQGIAIPQEEFKRPWLLDSKRVAFGFAERHATDAANLDQSVTTGRAQAVLSVNVPVQHTSGLVIFTLEVLPDRLHERMSDEWLLTTTFDGLPNALRDVQRVEPVDLVLNRRVDAKHTTPVGLYGYEPMNYKWRRNFVRLGGDFYQATPGTEYSEQRSAIWQTDIVDPTFSATHYLAPPDFPHTVFADAEASAFEFVARHNVAITGLTQMGDMLAENNDDYDAVRESGREE